MLMSFWNRAKGQKRKLRIEGHGSVVKALTNFPRCWERLASNHPEKTAGHMETTFREKREENSNCGHKSIILVVFLFRGGSSKHINETLQYHRLQMFKKQFGVDGLKQFLTHDCDLGKQTERKVLSLSPFLFVCLYFIQRSLCWLYSPSVITGYPTFCAIVAVKYDTHMLSRALWFFVL